MLIDFTKFEALLAGAAVATLAGWLGAFFALRKDERDVQIRQITEERTKWRDAMRSLTQEIVRLYSERTASTSSVSIPEARSKLVTNLNPKCSDDNNKIIEHFDNLFSRLVSDIDQFTKRMALLLKHDWERCKWECTPVYIKPFIRFTKKQREWRSQCYRTV